MSELKDPAIKLFGKTISLPQYEAADSSTTIVDHKIDRIRLHHHGHGGGVRRDNQSFSATRAASEDDKVFRRM